VTTSAELRTDRAPDDDVDRSSTQSRPLAGLGRLLRFMARRDRLRGPVWVVSVVGVFAASTGSVVGLYRTQAELQSYAELAQADVALKAVNGPGYGLDDPTTGTVVMNELQVFTFVVVALLSVFMVVRHTRAEEETGRAELVRAAPVGRHTILAAASLWVSVLVLAVGLGATAVLLAFGLGPAGSVAFGLAVTGTGLVLIGVAAVAAQVTSSARTATAAGGATLGAFFLLRAVGDIGSGWVTWLSPLGWAQNVRSFADERWWVLLLLLSAAAGLVAAAFPLSARRDLGAGLLRERPGPAGGGHRFGSPLAMAVRLQRASVLGWTAGVGAIGFFYGIVADQADDLLENEAFADLLSGSGQGSPAESFLATIALMTALVASGFTVSSVLRIRAEELAGRADPTLATPVSRRRWALSHLAVSVAGTAVVMVVAGLTTGVGYAVQLGDPGAVGTPLGADLVVLPALLVLAGGAFALAGLGPRWAPLAWVAVAVAAVVGLLAETLKLPQSLRDLSPFEHLPAVPAAPLELLPLLLLGLVAAALTAVGVLAIGRRDIG
jgi:ABC-2 type transport system permease protein